MVPVTLNFRPFEACHSHLRPVRSFVRFAPRRSFFRSHTLTLDQTREPSIDITAGTFTMIRSSAYGSLLGVAAFM